MSNNARPCLAADWGDIQEPHWWHSGFHAIPSRSVIVQEDDWDSIIAFALTGRYVTAVFCTGRKLDRLAIARSTISASSRT